jgi:hypothetical protein
MYHKRTMDAQKRTGWQMMCNANRLYSNQLIFRYMIGGFNNHRFSIENR